MTRKQSIFNNISWSYTKYTILYIGFLCSIKGSVKKIIKVSIRKQTLEVDILLKYDSVRVTKSWVIFFFYFSVFSSVSILSRVLF